MLTPIFRIPERRVTTTPEEIQELFSTPPSSRRGGRPGGQKAYDSGKEKRHTLKTQVVVTRRKKPPGPGRKPRRVRIVAVSKPFPGRCTTRRLRPHPGGVPARGRGGGRHRARRDTAGAPTRRPPRGELTDRQKAGNRRVSRRRIVVERGIGKMKIWRIVSDRYRNRIGRRTLRVQNVIYLHSIMF